MSKNTEYHTLFVDVNGREAYREDFVHHADAVREKISWESEGEDITAEIVTLSDSNLFDTSPDQSMVEERIAY